MISSKSPICPICLDDQFIPKWLLENGKFKYECLCECHEKKNEVRGILNSENQLSLHEIEKKLNDIQKQLGFQKHLKSEK